VALSKDDVVEVGKAVGAARAGHLTLAAELDIDLNDVEVAYMAGASGTYVDARKAQAIGMVPTTVKTMYQVGNTSLMMARELVVHPERVWEFQNIAKNLRAAHCMFADAPVFKQAYILELGYWTEGMPWQMYVKFLKKAGLAPPPEHPSEAQVVRIVDRDIPDLGRQGLSIVRDVGMTMIACFEGCTDCGTCHDSCPENAISVTHDEAGRPVVQVASADCLGFSCLRCQINCPAKVFQFKDFLEAE
jgi:methylamine methyltransferase corrinoid protein reductive activase